MKRIITLMIAAAMCIAMVAPASAVEINAKGDFHFAAIYRHNQGFSDNSDRVDNYWVAQRVRVMLEFIASDNLKGVLYIRTRNNDRWGGAGNGGSWEFGGNQTSLLIRQAYVDWKVPNTGLNLLIGMRHLTLPGAVAGSPVFNQAAAGITAAYKFNDCVSLAAIWARPWDDSTAPSDTTDLFVLSVPMTFDGFNINPWGLYGRTGKDGALGGDNHANLWYLGVAAEINILDPFKIAADFMYGALTRSGAGPEAKGWYADLKASYKFDLGTLSFFAWYASGDDEDDVADNELGRMPSFTSDGWGRDSEQSWKMSSFGGYGNSPMLGGGAISRSGVGTWGLGLGFENVSFVQDLFHSVRVLYWRGTNDDNIGASRGARYADFGEGVYLTEDESAWEINFDHRWNINKNLRMDLNIAWAYIDWDQDFRDANMNSRIGSARVNQWRAGLGFYYNF